MILFKKLVIIGFILYAVFIALMYVWDKQVIELPNHHVVIYDGDFYLYKKVIHFEFGSEK